MRLKRYVGATSRRAWNLCKAVRYLWVKWSEMVCFILEQAAALLKLDWDGKEEGLWEGWYKSAGEG